MKRTKAKKVGPKSSKEKQRGLLRKTVKFLLPIFLPHWRLALLLIVGTILLASIVYVTPLLFKFLIDTILIGHQTNLLLLFVACYTGAQFLSVGLRVAYDYFNRIFQLRLSFGMRDALFEHLEVLGTETVKRFKVGDLLERLDVDVEAFENIFDKVTDFVLNVFVLIFMFIATFYLNWKIALAIMAILPLYAFSQKYYVPKTRRLYQLTRTLSSGLLSFFEERLTAVTITKLFGRERYEIMQEKKRAKELMRADARATLVNSFASSLVGLISTAALLLVMWYGGVLVVQGALTIGSLVAIYTYTGNVFDPVESLASFWREMQEPLISVGRVQAILSVQPRVRDLRGAKTLENVKGAVRFEDIWFRYGQEYVLKDVSFDVKPGEHIGIVGLSGSGKTTMTLLIARFFEPQRGRILIDGNDIRNITLESLRRCLGYLPQEPTIFSASVLENIIYAKAGATEREVREAARRAGADAFIRRLSQGYATRLGQGGATLSGGERQRIALARLFLKDPAIVILDEPSAFLDTMTEESVRREFNKFFASRTFFIVSHRSAFLQGVNRIFTIKGQRLKEKVLVG